MGIENRGFASLSLKRRQELASKGGKAAHASGNAHQFTTEEARAAGKKGGIARALRAAKKAKDLLILLCLLSGLSSTAQSGDRVIIKQRKDNSFSITMMTDGLVKNFFYSDTIPFYKNVWVMYVGDMVLPAEHKHPDGGFYTCQLCDSCKRKLKAVKYKSMRYKFKARI